jgi:HEAT repeat protein
MSRQRGLWILISGTAVLKSRNAAVNELRAGGWESFDGASAKAALQAPDPEIRKTAVLALAGFPLTETKGALETAVQDEALPVQLAALHVFGALRTPESLKRLGELARDRAALAIAAIALLFNAGATAGLKIAETSSEPEIARRAKEARCALG